MNKEKFVIPADVYDTLELSALALGGIGADKMYTDDDAPYCALGHADFAGLPQDDLYNYKPFSIEGVAGPNDDAVYAINRRHRVPLNSRVTFKQWCRELNVVRGS